MLLWIALFFVEAYCMKKTLAFCLVHPYNISAAILWIHLSHCGHLCVCMVGHYVLPVFQMPSLEVNWTCHTFGSEPDLKMDVHNLGVPSWKRGAQKLYFWIVLQGHREFIANIFHRHYWHCVLCCLTVQWTVNGQLRIGFFTIKPVKAGEEITFNYQFETYGWVLRPFFTLSKLSK